MSEPTQPTQPLFEQYKDALRRGHVAALRNRLDAALLAYGEAAGIAPERPLPHVSLGGVLRRLGRNEEALVAYGRALERAPADVAALDGRAEVLLALGRRLDAADTLDRLAAAHDAAGELPEACDAARRALDLAESRPRRRLLEAIAARLADAPPSEAQAAALDQVRGVLGTVAEPVRGRRRNDPGDGTTHRDAAATDRTAEAPRDGAALAADAESLLDAGDMPAARDAFLAAAAAHRAAQRPNAAIDACYLALGIAPGDPDLHLSLAEIYLELGWQRQAVDKLALLARLADVGSDEATRERIRALVATRLPDEASLAAL